MLTETNDEKSGFDASNENLKIKTNNESESLFFKQLNSIIDLIYINNNNNDNNMTLFNNTFSQISSDNIIKLDNNFTNVIDEKKSHLVKKLSNKNNNYECSDNKSFINFNGIFYFLII